MQFKSKITAVYNIYNGFGEEVETQRTQLKCAVVKRNKHIKQTIKQRYRDYDMSIITAYRLFKPYVDLLSDDSLTFIYSGTEYKPEFISEINNSNGVTKFIEIKLKEKVV